MLVGPSGGGKTTVRTVLQRALSSMYATMAASHHHTEEVVCGVNYIWNTLPKLEMLAEGQQTSQVR